MAISTSLSQVYGEYLMKPYTDRSYQRVTKNSYGRLINNYYGKHSLYKKTLPTVNHSGLLTFNEDTRDVASTLDQLMKDSTLYTDRSKNKLKETVSSFIEQFNTLLVSFNDTENTEITSKNYMIDSVNELRGDELSSVGIIVNEDHTLTLDEEAFSEVKTSKLQSLFSGENSYGSLMAERVCKLGREALSLVMPVPQFYENNGAVNYYVSSGTLFNGYC